jgi:hypothetical protein
MVVRAASQELRAPLPWAEQAEVERQERQARPEPVELVRPPVMDLPVVREQEAWPEQAEWRAQEDWPEQPGPLLRAEPGQAEWPAQEDWPEPEQEAWPEQAVPPEWAAVPRHVHPPVQRALTVRMEPVRAG